MHEPVLKSGGDSGARRSADTGTARGASCMAPPAQPAAGQGGRRALIRMTDTARAGGGGGASKQINQKQKGAVIIIRFQLIAAGSVGIKTGLSSGRRENRVGFKKRLTFKLEVLPKVYGHPSMATVMVKR